MRRPVTFRVPHRASALLLAMLLGGFAPGRAANVIDVSSCDVEFTGAGQLSQDLDCSGDGVRLGTRSKLFLNGFTITGPGSETLTTGIRGVGTGRMRVVGPGTVSGFGWGIYSTSASLLVEDLAVLDNGQIGIYSGKQVRANDVTANGNGDGISSGKVKVFDVTANGNDRFGVFGSGSLTRVTANGNGSDGIRAAKITGREIITTGNGGAGVDARRYALRHLTSTGNTGPGLRAARLGTSIAKGTLAESTLTGNCGGTGADILTDHLPKLIDTTCGASQVIDDEGVVQPLSWAICPGDGLGMFCPG